MQMSQYVYGRKPDRGLDVIARSRDLPFYQPDWLNATRYGSAPAEETPERIWTLRFELQSLDRGGVLSCLYPLKQTVTPCSQQRPPYPKGITPAVHHMLISAEDWPVLLQNPEAALTYDAFLAIDDIYTLGNGFLGPVTFAPKPVELTLDDGWLLYQCPALAAAPWRAFMARKQKKLGLLSQSRVLLIVPRSDPETELRLQRAILAHTLALLPQHVRRYASVTLNLDVECADLPPGSALYGMSRANPASQPGVSGVVFDIDRRLTPAANDAERSYFAARAAGKVSPYFDAILALLPQADDLDFCLRLRQVEEAVQAADPDAAAALTRLIETERLQAQQAPLLNACVQASLAACAADASAANLATLWRLLGVAGADGYRQACLSTLKPPAEHLLAVLARDPALALPSQAEAQDDLFCEMAAQRLAGGAGPLSESLLGQLRYVWDNEDVPAERLPAWQALANALFASQALGHGPQALADWAQTTRMLRLPGLRLPEDVARHVASQDADALWGLLLRLAAVNAGAPQTTALERLTLAAVQQGYTGHRWSLQAAEMVMQRIQALRDNAEDWPALLLAYLASDGVPSEYAELGNRLMRLPWVRDLPGQRAHTGRLFQAYASHTLSDTMAAMAQAEDTPQIERFWKAQAGALPLPQLAQPYQGIVETRLQQLYDGLTPARAVALYPKLRLVTPYQEYGALASAVLGRAADTLLDTPLENVPKGELLGLLALLEATGPTMSYEHQYLLDALRAVRQLDICTRAKPSGNRWFADLRKQFELPYPDARKLAIAVAGKAYGDTQAGVLLAAQKPDGGIDWYTAFPALLIHQLGAANVPGERATLSQETLDQIKTLLIRLMTDPHAPDDTHWLSVDDMNDLAAEIRSRYPALLRGLQRDQKKNRDLPQLLVEKLGLA